MIRTRAQKRLSVMAVLSAMALVVLDAGLFNVALPTVGASLDAAPGQVILVVSGYQAVLLIGLLPSAHLAGRLGHRRLFAGGLALYGAASIACAFAPSLAVLVAARAVQGLGGATIMALGIALLRLALGPDFLGKAIGWNALTVALCSAAGPIVGALILSVAPWPWLFLAKLPLCAVALLATRALPETPKDGQPIDVVGIALHAATISMVLAVAGLAIAHPATAALLVGPVIALGIGLVQRHGTHEAPLWPVDLLALRPFRVAVLASIFCFTGQSAGLLALPFYLQLALDQGPMNAGLVMTCWPLTVALTSSIANRLAERFGSAPLCVVGGLALASGLMLSALWPTAASLAPLSIGAALSGLGFGLFQVPNNRTLFLSVPPHRSAAAGGMQGSARLIGQTLGALFIGLLLAGIPAAIAPRIGFALASLFALAAALTSASELFPARGKLTCSRFLKGGPQ